jgi:uncharacterized protein (DUF342 family)
LIVKGGIIGKMKNIIKVHGSAEARFVNGHHVRALGNIAIQDESLNSKLESGNDIYLWKKGILSGGETFCFGRLDAKVIGSESGNYTDIYFGFESVITTRIGEIKTERDEISGKCRETRGDIFQYLRTIVAQGREPTEAEVKETARKKADLFSRYEEFEKLEQEEEALLAKRKKGSSPMVTVREWIFTGVKLAATTTTTYVREKRHVCGTYIVIGPEVVLSKLIE